MNRFIRVILISITISAILCGAALIVGRAQPADPPLPELARCGDTFCVFGIKPDSISFDDAHAALLRTGQFSFSSPSNQKVYKQTPLIYRLELLQLPPQTGDNSMHEVALYFYDFAHGSIPNVAEIINQLGLPCEVRLSGGGPITLYYKGLSLFVIPEGNQPPTNRLDFSMDVIIINLVNDAVCGPNPVQNGNVRWRGFTDYSNPLS